MNLDPERPAFFDDAACKGMDVNLFFPTIIDLETGRMARGGYSRDVREACAACPVTDECLDYAMNLPGSLPGWWAGTTPKDRQRMRLARRVPT